MSVCVEGIILTYVRSSGNISEREWGFGCASVKCASSFNEVGCLVLSSQLPTIATNIMCGHHVSEDILAFLL